MPWSSARTRHAYPTAATRWPTSSAMLAPRSSLQHFLEDVAALARAGKLTRRGLAKTTSALLQTAVMTQQGDAGETTHPVDRPGFG
jgi:hypothetical protein